MDPNTSSPLPTMAELHPDAVSSSGARFWTTAPRAKRVQCAVWAGLALAAVALGRWLTPDPRGVGTHQQLGLPPCFTLTALHIPCPFCGMTTAFSAMAHGQFARAFITQPAGALIFIATLGGAAGLLVMALSGRIPAGVMARPWRNRGLALSAVILILAWLYKIAIVLATR